MLDVLVIGGGHAGCEAAAAAARRGAKVGLVTFRAEDIGQMSCNPSIGGVGKGHLVRELDVFGGLMARAADCSAIHRRMLNRSKGSAVHGPRVQADRRQFQQATKELLNETPVNMVIGEATEISIRCGRVLGVVVDGQTIAAAAVVLATGTFLDAQLYCGLKRIAGGRTGEKASLPLAAQLREWGVAQGRLKTGTPPRLDGRTIDWARTTPQPSDAESWSMSGLAAGPAREQLACAITRTTAVTHEVIRKNFGQSPLFSGAIEGRGPRYCPSIEDKIRRFGDRDGHQIFLEPEGLDTHLVYPNGISTSLPVDVQMAFVRTIAGLERAEIVRPGYAVEYEYVDARKLDSTLGHREIDGLFLCGQINGTTGYEEAAAQGLAAGLNAAAHALGVATHRFERRTSYIGVMIDDLTLQGVQEPYRMMTARAEYRLALRADNAVTRLGQNALALECVSPRQREAIESHFELRTRSEFAETDEGKADALYAPYVERQQREWAAVNRDMAIRIPGNFNYSLVPGLSAEAVEKLRLTGPESLEQASRIPGITPAALAALHVATTRRAA